ncbi:MAG: M24 family metallopeptidase [Halobacteriaceae archaeon]
MRAPPTRYGFLSEALAAADAAAYVHVGDRRDPTLRYLARVSGPPGRVAFVYVDGTATLLVPEAGVRRARREFAGDAVEPVSAFDARDPGVAAAGLLDRAGVAGTVLSPRHVPHDAALYVEGDRRTVTASDAVATRRERKSEAALEATAAVGEAAAVGLDAAAAALADATRERDGRLHADGAPLTTERLRRTVDAALAGEGVAGAGNTVVAAGRAATDPQFAGDVPVEVGDPVVVDVTPRGPHGHHARLARTFLVDSDGGWDRRAEVAVRAAVAAGTNAVDPGEAARVVRQEVRAEVRAHGFATDREGVGFDGDAGGGVGLAPRERPALDGGATLAAGHVLAVAAGVCDPREGGVRRADTVAVTDDGVRSLTDYDPSRSP